MHSSNNVGFICGRCCFPLLFQHWNAAALAIQQIHQLFPFAWWYCKHQIFFTTCCRRGFVQNSTSILIYRMQVTNWYDAIFTICCCCCFVYLLQQWFGFHNHLNHGHLMLIVFCSCNTVKEPGDLHLLAAFSGWWTSFSLIVWSHLLISIISCSYWHGVVISDCVAQCDVVTTTKRGGKENLIVLIFRKSQFFCAKGFSTCTCRRALSVHMPQQQ